MNEPTSGKTNIPQALADLCDVQHLLHSIQHGEKALTANGKRTVNYTMKHAKADASQATLALQRALSALQPVVDPFSAPSEKAPEGPVRCDCERPEVRRCDCRGACKYAAGVGVLPPGVEPSPEGFGKVDLTGIKRGPVRTAGVPEPDESRRDRIGQACAEVFGWRKCEFCGCNTNANARACCEKGRAADGVSASDGKGFGAKTPIPSPMDSEREG